VSSRIISIVLSTLLLICFKGTFAKDNQSYIKVITNSPLTNLTPNKFCESEICLELISLIDNAEDSIDFAIYGLRGQDEVLSALINAKKRGVKIRGVIDKDIFNDNYYSDTYLLESNFDNIRTDYKKDLKTLSLITDKKFKDKCLRPKDHKGPLQCFEGKGYASKEKLSFVGDIMHNKFFIVDEVYVWTGSANISDTGVGGYNANVVASIKSKFVADYYLIEFEQMYTDGSFHRAKKKLKKKEIQTNINGQNVELFFSPQGYAMYRGVIPMIKQAKKSIDASIFFLTHKNISKELVAAKKRGVDVRVIIDATSASNGYSKHQYLRDNGISLKVENWGGKMHMKSAIIDKKHLIIGSMNWTSAGESKNDENTLIIKNFKDAQEYQRFYNSMWNSIPSKWLREDPLPESKDSGSSCYDGIDNDFDDKIDKKDQNCLN
jgi:phosphatidylserine/phosphatidylglycerophosphate/cardiolipin synthase-like enzyme